MSQISEEHEQQSDGGFTPGPWSELHNTAGPMGVIALREPLTAARRICWLEIHGEEHANARLIAAAPDMFDALRAARDAVEGHFDDNCDVCREAIDMIRAALARATGAS